MSINVYVKELEQQCNSIKLVINEYTDKYNKLESAVHLLNDSGLEGTSYTSAKNYFSTVYLSLSRGMRILCEELVIANNRLLNDYKQMVYRGDLNENSLIYQIEAINQILAMDEYTEYRNDEYYYSLRRSIEDKLEKLYYYNAYSATIFTRAYSLLLNVQNGIKQIQNNKEWDSVGSRFLVSGISSDWINSISEEWLYYGMSEDERYAFHMKNVYGFDDDVIAIMEQLRVGLKERFPNKSQNELDYLYLLILGRLQFGDYETNNSDALFRWDNTAGDPLMFFFSTIRTPTNQELVIKMFEELGVSEEEYRFLRYKIRMQYNITSFPETYIWERAKDRPDWKDFMRKALGYSEEEFTNELYEKLWKEQFEAFSNKGDFAHFAITSATILRDHYEITDTLSGSKDNIDKLAGWKGDATDDADIYPSLKSDDYISDLDAANIPYLMKKYGTSFLETTNHYYHNLSDNNTRANIFLEHTSLEEVTNTIFSSMYVVDMDDLKNKYYDSYRFIKNLEAGNNELEDYE